ncbi:manganese efflux pump MntP [Williamwhitmania taraxaci]|uniref:Putative manganese efflux pump MntP n=1 Tax=Williamwhitmania taraxaci TaxID=1640674 RepID=A0A1G6ILE6_9BACT|nr:manganese efflux pump MntP family protein [Williamwhitmania taraxaci]SDC07339.1 Putative Mn2+ efflux pump MntP [Williamwhitmania taraxaci]
MEFFTLLAIAIGLSFDTFAVSVSTGIVVCHIRFWQAVRVALILALFQGAMPVIGWLFGLQVAEMMSDYDHWLAFVMLTILGMKMIWESFQKEETNGKKCNPLKLSIVVGMAIATSIDALVVGVSFAFLQMNILWAALVIGAVTFMAAMLGMLFGKKIGNKLGKKMEIIGGVMLIAIGLKILLEHTGII